MSNKRFGYARVSTTDQNEERQVLELLESGIEERDIYVDKQSGRSFERTNYLALRNTILRKGDVLVVKSIDRFGRNYSAIRAEWEFLTKTLGVDIVVLDTPILDTTQYKDLLGSVITDIVLAVLSFGAQLEVDTKSKAQAEGIAAAHLKGVKFGRPRCTVEGWDTPSGSRAKSPLSSAINSSGSAHLHSTVLYGNMNWRTKANESLLHILPHWRHRK